MVHDPRDPAVTASYDALLSAIKAQYSAMIAAGIRIIFGPDDPYANSAEMLADVTERQTLRVYADAGATLPVDHPMKKWYWDRSAGDFVCANDVFRAVHDYMGHTQAPYVSFGPRGEWEAWRQHRRTLPETSWMALWCETRGQNTWTNYYADHAALPLPERPYAVQKAGAVPISIYAADGGDL
jgi:hypothetical protein